MSILEVSNLSKKIGNKEIIRNISFSIEEGEIFGFLGPNGSGKTTTIRMLVDLIAMNTGTIKILGNDIRADREKALEHIGAVVESPELYNYLSGYENLMQIARIRKIGKARVDEVVELLGLSGRISDKMRKYSLGMKQRLGLAASLLSSPKLLILDEPTNGLDPNGIIEFRNLLKKLSREDNLSVFISSHMLSEVQQLCDRVAFIENGVITSVERIGQAQEEMVYLLETEPNDLTESILSSIPGIESFRKSALGYMVTLGDVRPSVLLKELIAKDIEVSGFARHLKGLEERYLELVKGGIR